MKAYILCVCSLCVTDSYKLQAPVISLLNICSLILSIYFSYPFSLPVHSLISLTSLICRCLSLNVSQSPTLAERPFSLTFPWCTASPLHYHLPSLFPSFPFQRLPGFPTFNHSATIYWTHHSTLHHLLTKSFTQPPPPLGSLYFPPFPQRLPFFTFNR